MKECRDCRFLMIPNKGNQWCLIAGQLNNEKLRRNLAYGDCKDWKKILTLDEIREERVIKMGRKDVIKDRLNYLQSDDKKFKGVSSSKSGVKFDDNGYGYAEIVGGRIDINDFNEMCIAWLCLYKPDVIAQDKDGGGK